MAVAGASGSAVAGVSAGRRHGQYSHATLLESMGYTRIDASEKKEHRLNCLQGIHKAIAIIRVHQCTTNHMVSCSLASKRWHFEPPLGIGSFHNHPIQKQKWKRYCDHNFALQSALSNKAPKKKCSTSMTNFSDRRR